MLSHIFLGNCYKYCCQAQIQNMSTLNDSRQVHTRNSARMFGFDLTNLAASLPVDPKKPKSKKPKPSLSTQWLQTLPEVRPYLTEIHNHTRSLQHESYIPADFMAWHSDITPAMRGILMGWLLEMHWGLCGNQHTLYLAVLLIDKYCHGRFVSRGRYQLLGIAALFVAAKYQEVKTPKLKHYHNICGGQFTMDQILAMQSDILVTLSFKIKAMTSCWHLEEYFHFADIMGDYSHLCLYILDLSLLQYAFCLIRPTILSWSIVLFVIRSRHLNEINETEISNTFHIQQGQLREVTDLVEALYNNRKQGRFKAVNEKYIPVIHYLIV